MTLSTTIAPVLSQPVNLRDLGGTPVADDGVIAPGFAIRTYRSGNRKCLGDHGLFRGRDGVPLRGR